MKIYGGYFDVDQKLKKILEINEKVSAVDFWEDKISAQKEIAFLNSLKEDTEDLIELKTKVDDYLILEPSISEEEFNELLKEEINNLEDKIIKINNLSLLNEENDTKDVVLEIHAGAGGTEACDWANMLYRMYSRWCEKNNYKCEELDIQKEEVGIKSVLLEIKGKNSYGYLKSEKGVHRLVRISPFDSNKRRHTSFASVEVIPIFESLEIEIKENDLKIDVYRSGGAGGQSVNTTDSAVRITHLPTGIVVTCQNERSQLKNKEKAMQILTSKIKQTEEAKKHEEKSALKSNQNAINFGSQIRSYVMCPYVMVKDHRTNEETSNIDKVLDGEIDMFIEAYLKWRVNNG